MRNAFYRWVLVAAVAAAGVCRAASGDYLVVDLSSGVYGPYTLAYTNAAPAGGWTNILYATSRLVLRKIPRGSFLMGSPTNEAGRATDGTEDQQTVVVSNDYYIGIFEVTEGQYRRVRGTSWPDTSLPVRDDPSLSYSEFIDYFLNAFNSRNTNNLTFALPGEEQWERACRAGSTEAYCFGSDTNQLVNYAWYLVSRWQPVGQKAPNAFGLYDMHGNVAEASRRRGESGGWICGGSYNKDAYGCRSAIRTLIDEGSSRDGFRLCLTVPLELFTVTVSNGTAEAASGTNGQAVAIWADPPASLKVFDRWTGDTQTVASVFATNTTLRIAGSNVTVTATYRDAPFTLTVVNGSGDGQYQSGDPVAVVADAPAPGQMFNYWGVVPGGVDLGAGFVAGSASTWITMPPTHAILTAVYTSIPTYTLTVNGGTGGGAYTNGHVVAIAAGAPPAHHTFQWAGQTATVADVTAWETVLIMPPSNVTVSATYPPVQYALTVHGGLGSGSYTNGQIVTVTATNWPSAWHAFDFWSGDTNALADVHAATTTVTVAGAASLTPVYRPVGMPDNTYMVVDLTAAQPSLAVSYRDDVPAGGWTGAYQTNKLVLRKIAAGTFLMGSPTNEPGRSLEEARHSVTLTKVFYLGLFELTQAQWYRVKGSWPSFASNAVDRLVRPVERVSYVQARGATNSANWPSTAAVESDSFMGQLRAKTGDTAFDLPTEAQWEYACRAGTAGAYGGTGVLDAMGWYGANSAGVTHAVGQQAANAWGLYDMHGNVHELCLDWYAGDYSTTNQFDPRGAIGSLSNRRIMRGGAYPLTADLCRSAYRGNLLPTNTFTFAGLRVARTAEAAYRLTVVDGLVNTGGLYYAGTQIPVSPVRKAGWRTFLRWVAEPAGAQLGGLFDAAQADTVVTQPAYAVTLTARYQTRCVIMVR